MTEEEFKKGFQISREEDLGKYFYFLSNTNNDDDYIPFIIESMNIKNLTKERIHIKKMIASKYVDNVDENILKNIGKFINMQLDDFKKEKVGELSYLCVFKIN